MVEFVHDTSWTLLDMSGMANMIEMHDSAVAGPVSEVVFRILAVKDTNRLAVDCHMKDRGRLDRGCDAVLEVATCYEA